MIEDNAKLDLTDSAIMERTYSAEELAIAEGTTVRNIRAYQTKGLLPNPALARRRSQYTEAHRTRLRRISLLVRRGYTISCLKELFDAYDQGKTLEDVLNSVE